jgi:hypothetical protein
MRTEIAEKNVEMDLSFIIILDDLDRLRKLSVWSNPSPIFPASSSALSFLS